MLCPTLEVKPAHQSMIMSVSLSDIANSLRTQDNLATADPMFCVQKLVRDVGYELSYTDGRCWVNSRDESTVYDDDEDFEEPVGDDWEVTGYKDRWETVMVAFTRAGCNDYLAANGHNVRAEAHNGRVRTYVESFFRCGEMLRIRAFLLAYGINS